jgi:penicillin amidase
MTPASIVTPDRLTSLQRDITSPNARKFIDALRLIGLLPENLVPARTVLLDWDAQMRGDRPAAALYWAWESAIRQRLAARLVKPELVDEFAARLEPVSTLEGPVSRGGGGDIGPWRDILLADALSDAIAEVAGEADVATALASARADLTFAHPLGVFAIGQRRFNVGPYQLPGHTDTMQTTDGRRGATVRGIFDLSEWNRSLIVNAPGQSGSPSSVHYDDLMSRWTTGSLANLVFDQSGAADKQTETLRLEPR